MDAAKIVPIWIPLAPSINAAAIPLPSAIPPAAITGIFTASTTCGTSTIVVSSPICPPASVPSATTASAPQRSIRFASATDAMTGITLTPAAFQSAMYFSGLPAPVVTTLMSSSRITFAILSASGFINMMFTPNGLSVSFFVSRICSLTHSAGAPPAAISPRPPALDTAAAR